jgi:small multidrug resistance family-3 protein
MRNLLDQIVAHRSGTLFILALAAFLEAYGDSSFQAALYRSSGMSRMIALLIGAVSLVAYGLMVNTPRWDFGQLLGLYVVLFFLLAQIVARVRFGHAYLASPFRRYADSRRRCNHFCLRQIAILHFGNSVEAQEATGT